MTSTTPTRADVEEAFSALDGWITTNGWAGYDPYDIRGQDWFVRLFGAQNRLARKVRGALAILEQKAPPMALRRLLRIRKEINPKGMGLLASAYLTRWQSTGDLSWRTRAEDVLEWLATNPCREYPGMSWGYPFHWQSRIFLPRGTPSVVVTGTIGDAWLNHYALTGDSRSLAVATEIATFFREGLNRPIDEDDRLCFSYTPLDDFKVHNASLFGAAFLARLAKITESREHASLAIRAARYTLSEQNPDGSFYYWGSEPPTIIDHYHTGFVLRHLHSILHAGSASFIEDPLKAGYSFYLNHLFNDEGVPKFTPDSLYPIDVHSCAEALLCICQLHGEFGGYEKLGPVFRFTQDTMRTDEGWYVAEVRNAGRVEIPYLRWGQAWMQLALAKLDPALAGEQNSPEGAS